MSSNSPYVFDKSKFPDEAARKKPMSLSLLWCENGRKVTKWTGFSQFPTVALRDSATMRFITAFAEMETVPPLLRVIGRALKPCHREGSFLLNSVGKLPVTTYSVCTSEARLTQNSKDKGGIHRVLALGLGWDTDGEEWGSVLSRRGSTEPSSGDRWACAGDAFPSHKSGNQSLSARINNWNLSRH